ncbi:MAG TPA: glycosyltransferase family A protein, partial [Terriglobia bacterium]|nr:glycosyltransferase family A protein [Terriglobia bacterium]
MPDTPQAKISVAIPSYNRKVILRKTIEGYLHQTVREEILEILIVDDGSTDGTAEAVTELGGTSPIPIRCLRQEKKGQAAGRNYGIREARGELILFGDDDVVPAPNMVGVHLAWHKAHPEPSFAVMGRVPWA